MSDIVKAYYNENAEYEWDRLNNPYSKVEFESTLYLVDKYFPKKGKVIDIGCGPGRYSIELLKRGYNATLSDISQEELKIAEDKIKELGLKAEGYICANALELDYIEDESFDAILLMGPMYHIRDREDRINIIKNVYRILKKNGTAIIAYINSWGVVRAGITEFAEEFSNIQRLYDYMGEQSFTAEQSFTESYFTIPPKALEEVKESGFNVVSYAGAESFVSGTHTEMIKLFKENRAIYDNLIKVAAEKCEEKQYRDATEHLNIVVRK